MGLCLQVLLVPPDRRVTVVLFSYLGVPVRKLVELVSSDAPAAGVVVWDAEVRAAGDARGDACLGGVEPERRGFSCVFGCGYSGRAAPSPRSSPLRG